MKPRKPLKRSTKPIKRIGKRGKKRNEAMGEARRYYFMHHGYFCQFCKGPFEPYEIVDIHHKLKRSLGGKDDLENLLAMHRVCHSFAHSSNVELDKVRFSKANIENGEFV